MARMSAAERREVVLQAAVAEFARRGFGSASTTAIAQGAGVSQPYLFRLFPNKRAVFLAAVEEGFARTEAELTTAAEGLTGDEAIDAVRRRYQELLTDTRLLQFQLQVYCAALDDDEFREKAASCLARLWRAVAGASGVPPQDVFRFFANGMLRNVVTALGLPCPSDPDELATGLHSWAMREV
ncbi:TetR/AcrR family transcriptional regulator [Streptomyces sp. NPDC052040]|uniref:TetR/AcrR family transcriptional regulator n=1 Tax=unclassified Streptomyces TaxID=2593676 RepID=UPI0037D57534